MAKKEPTLQDAVDRFIDQICKKGKFSKFIQENKLLYSKNKNNVTMFIDVEQTLWNALPDEFMKNVRELNLEEFEDQVIRDKFLFMKGWNDGTWISLAVDDLKSDIFEIDFAGAAYKIQINIKMFPILFKKDDLNNFYYKLELGEKPIFLLKKYYEGLVPDTGFTIIRAFHPI